MPRNIHNEAWKMPFGGTLNLKQQRAPGQPHTYWLLAVTNKKKANRSLLTCIAPHSSTLAWKILRMEEPGRLQSMGLLRVSCDGATSLPLFTFMHWRRKWKPTPVFLSGESQGRGSLVGCHLCGRTESDTTEVTQQQQL